MVAKFTLRTLVPVSSATPTTRLAPSPTGALHAGSLVAALAQGIALGALLQGIAVEGRAYAGGWWDWLTPFSLLVGASLVVA